MQTIGTLIALVGLVIALFSGAYHADASPGPDHWLGTISPYVAAFLVVIGIIISIVGRVRKGGPT